jgi:isoamylase
MLSQGRPMFAMGDEVRRTQQGNNNAYCQDNEISWFDWSQREHRGELGAFVRRLIMLRKRHPVFRRRDFFDGEHVGESGLRDVWWFRPDGRQISRRDWASGASHALGVFLNGEEIPASSTHGEPLVDHAFLILFNSGHEDLAFQMPARRFGNRWRFTISTADPLQPEGAWHVAARASVSVPALSAMLLRRAW